MFAGYPDWFPRRHDDPAPAAARPPAGDVERISADLVGIRPSTAKRHLADLRAKSGLSTEQLIYVGRAAGWLVVPSLESL
jgi:hypothetical protein